MELKCTGEVSEVRKHKPQRRSRFGCRNCKLRKVKCDQGKPRCEKCTSFGVLCNFFSPNVSDLRPIETTVGWQGRAKTQPVAPVWTHDAATTYQYHLDTKCRDFITRYLGRGLTTPNDPGMVQVNRRLLELAFAVGVFRAVVSALGAELMVGLQYPYLMHASLAVALTYDRYLNGSSNGDRTPEECFHWYRSTVLLNQRLRSPVHGRDRDPIWGTAAALAMMTFTSPDGCTAEQAWPLRSSNSSGLEWLHMSKGKMSLWHAVNPLRPDSIFSVMSETYGHMHSPLPNAGMNGVPGVLAAVCGIGDSSTTNDNPYFEAAHALSRTLQLPDAEVSTGHAQLFIGIIRGSFKDLLEERDPVALLLLYLWYRKAGRSIWWIELRARVECSAIRLYLERYLRENDAVRAFLPGGDLDRDSQGESDYH